MDLSRFGSPSVFDMHAEYLKPFDAEIINVANERPSFEWGPLGPCPYAARCSGLKILCHHPISPIKETQPADMEERATKGRSAISDFPGGWDRYSCFSQV
ncbi:hypothetical protein AVEN_189961-1 [Araneus ventricosus]|uniref:Uncharacterized protein n=1 Tax=Araneus ventricosus TaxID=182803 RepID=A0A4Y2THK8_ARAVE|nr:hypothetical protein AVEN_189961-1 [Araneus ventricosus]